MQTNVIYNCDCLEGLCNLPSDSVDCCVTSPPYFNLRDYGVNGQIGKEDTPEQYIQKLVNVFHEVKRVLTSSGTLWVVIGDSYNGYKGNAKGSDFGSDFAGYKSQPCRKSKFGLESKNAKVKDLIGIPWMLAFALRNDGWYLRQDIIWAKPNPMPESVTDRCTKSHEYIFLLSKSPKYYFDAEAIHEKTVTKGAIPKKSPHRYGGDKYTAHPDEFYRTKSVNAYMDREYRNKRDVWIIPPRPTKEAHFATFPERLVANCILAGCPVNGVVLDPFMGSGTTAVVACKLGRGYVGFELNPNYVSIAQNRLANTLSIFNQNY